MMLFKFYQVWKVWDCKLKKELEEIEVKNQY
jgi:hypothetical protein